MAMKQEGASLLLMAPWTLTALRSCRPTSIAQPTASCSSSEEFESHPPTLP